MLEGLALLIAILGLIILLQTMKKYRKMREINRNSSSVMGTVKSSTASRKMIGGPLSGTAYHNLIQYQPPDAKEPLEILEFEHDLVMVNDYSQGDSVEVVYDAEALYRAYPKPEWERALSNFTKAWICFGISAALLVILLIFK